MVQYAVVGDPIAHSKSPQIHQMFAEQTGEAMTYTKERVSEADFDDYVQAFFAQGGGGLNITSPHKEAAFSLVKQITVRAQLAKAVNTLWISDESDEAVLCADNTDGVGIVRDLSINNNVPLTGKRILMLGAGGAARGALASLIETKPERILVLNRTISRAQSMQKDFESVYQLEVADLKAKPHHSFDVIINATSSSIPGVVPQVNSNYLSDNSCCYDMMYADRPTPFMEWGRDNGATKVLDGLGMLVEQAAESFSIWHGVRPDTGPVMEALRY